MIDPGVTSSFISQWGAYGGILVLLLGVVAYLFISLQTSQKDRMADTKDLLVQSLKDSAATAEVLKDLKGSIDANSKTMEATIAVLKAQNRGTNG
jgi:hypothetical protein